MRQRRKRGGQPGNQNARKHGLYSLAATPAQRRAISGAAKINTLDQEIALLRVKIKSALKNNPENIGAISNAAGLLGSLIKLEANLGGQYFQTRTTASQQKKGKLVPARLQNNNSGGGQHPRQDE